MTAPAGLPRFHLLGRLQLPVEGGVHVRDEEEGEAHIRQGRERGKQAFSF